MTIRVFCIKSSQNTKKKSDIWKKILDTASAVPAPLTFFDGTTLMGPAVVGRGTQKALDVFEKLLENEELTEEKTTDLKDAFIELLESLQQTDSL